ncbi:MAG TPA: PD-(D/E)XK nuclease family protein [Nitrolancea sp.]|nr:PD-(D/E)XK nuclease family protein [Nitrolancea sp.]
MEMEAASRREPFIWVSWLAKVMAGQVSCEWQYWFQAHHKLLSKQPSTFDALGWQIGHTRLLSEVKREVVSSGLRPRTEFGVEFRLPGLEAKISGKADCLVVDGSNVMIYDCKTGKPRESDRVQVMIYMYGLATYPQFATSRIRGTVIYRDERFEIPYLPETFASDLGYFATLLAMDEEPARQPGQDCDYCNIASVDCPDRP